MRTYESFATELLNELTEDGVSQVDPAVILALIELLKNLLPVFLEQCKKQGTGAAGTRTDVSG